MGVFNQILIKSGIESGDVKKRIEEALKRNAEVEAEQIHVFVSKGAVTLEGKVKSWYERELAERAAWAVRGVQTVTDRIQIS